MAKKKLKTIVFILIALLLVLGGFCLFLSDQIGNSTSKDFVIKLRDSVFVSARSWGLTGDHQEIIFSSKPISPAHRSYSADSVYIFYTSEVFYKVDNDSVITVYASESSVSESTMKYSNVVIKGLKSGDALERYNADYQRYGLKRISVYEK